MKLYLKCLFSPCVNYQYDFNTISIRMKLMVYFLYECSLIYVLRFYLSACKRWLVIHRTVDRGKLFQGQVIYSE